MEANPRTMDLFSALSREACLVNQIKQNSRFSVVIGNPPYSLLSSNLESYHRELVEPYKFIDGNRMKERGALQMEKILNDDYVKFLSLAERMILATSVGVIGLITNHAYLDNPTMRGMRHHFLSSFQKLWILNLGGSAKKSMENSTDENVFDIQQGVCISICARVDSERQIRYGALAGTRLDKYSILKSRDLSLSAITLEPQADLFLFVPSDLRLWDEYKHFYALNDIFPLHSIGAFTSKDHFVIAHDPSELVENAKRFRDSKLGDDALCRKLSLNAKKAWNVGRSRIQIRELSDRELRKKIISFPHRPFDQKHLFYHRSLIWSMAWPVNQNMLAGDNLALVTSRQLAAPPWKHIYCSNTVVEMFYISNKTKEGNHVFPMYIFEGRDQVEGGQRDISVDKRRRPNVNRTIVDTWSKSLGLSWCEEDRGDLKKSWGAVTLFEYVYGLLHSETYRTRYEEFLVRSFPRVPLAKSPTVLRDLAVRGRDLVELHLPGDSAKARKSPKSNIAQYHGPKGSVVGRGYPRYEGGIVRVSEQAWFSGVPENVWEWRVGVYQPCKKWLRDRRDVALGKDEIAVYQHMIEVIKRTMEICKDIDELIERHGGWPTAFAISGLRSRNV